MAKSRKLTAQEKSLWRKVTKDVLGKTPLETSDNPPEGLPQTSLQASSVKMPNTILDRANSKGLTSPKSPVKKRKNMLSRKLKSTAAATKPSNSLEPGYLAKLLHKYDASMRPIQKTTPKYSHHHQINTHDLHEKPQNQPLERTVRQKLQRGRADIEARLDLHGSNRLDAQHRLMKFLQTSFQQGFKTVIVVTGKGDGPISRHNLHSAERYAAETPKASAMCF